MNWWNKVLNFVARDEFMNWFSAQKSTANNRLFGVCGSERCSEWFDYAIRSLGAQVQKYELPLWVKNMLIETFRLNYCIWWTAFYVVLVNLKIRERFSLNK